MHNPALILPVAAIAFYIFGYYRSVLLYAGFIMQVAYLLWRGMSLGRLPIVGPHDTLFFLSVSTMLFGIPIAWKMKDKERFLYPAVGLAVFFAVISLFYPPHDAPLSPILKTFWFETHVAMSFFSYALFGIAAILGAGFLKSGQSSDEALQYKIIFVGYTLFSAAMIFGGIWAYYAWGTYWLWTPKELWTVILWLFYSLYLHARLRKWWTGKPSAILGIVGFAVVMFTYLGVSLLMKSSHTF